MNAHKIESPQSSDIFFASLTAKISRIFALALLLILGACASNPNKAERIDTNVDKKGHISGDENVALKDGNMIVQKKVQMNEELRRLQYEVYELEDRVYGNRKYGSLGLYGSLKDCRTEISDKKNGGNGKLMWTEPIDRVTDKEEEFKIGLDENDKLVGVTEEFLSDRLQRFRGYKQVLMKRQDEYDEKLAICKAELKSRKYDLQQNKTGEGN